MNQRILLPIAIGVAALLAAAVYQNRPAAHAAQDFKAVTPTHRTPVVVELFTSEGCSSCPPADALLARLDQAQPVPGAEVVALEQHVDYWNHLGWRDPFSSAQMSARQDEYARAFGNNGVYTPQMVVDGRTEFVGSSEGQARNAIARAAAATKTQAHLRIAGEKSGALALEVRIEPLAEAKAGDAEVLLAVTESRLESDVARGENAGRHLSHAGVVRELRRIGIVDSRAPFAFVAEPMLTLAPTWKRENLRVVVFVQERKSRRILAAASIPLAAQ